MKLLSVLLTLILASLAFALPKCHVKDGTVVVVKLDTVVVNGQAFLLRTLAAKDAVVCPPDTAAPGKK